MIKFNYYGTIGIIDWWSLSMTKSEVISKLGEYLGSVPYNEVAEIFEKAEKFIIETMISGEGEKPHTIRYFTVPSDGGFDVCAVAKISNNGTTVCFVCESDVLVAAWGGYHGVIKSCHFTAYE